MSRPRYRISRRAFIATSAHLLALLASFRTRKASSAVIDQAPPSERSYGGGAYGQGPYSGSYRTYVPLVKNQGG